MRTPLAAAWLATMATMASGSPGLLFVTTAPNLNELLGIAREHSAELGGTPPLTFTTVAAAIQAATAGDGLLVTADLYRNPVIGSPQRNCTPTISAEHWAKIKAMKLRMYVEFPAALDDGVALAVGQTIWERAVVTKAIGPAGGGLAKMGLLHPHKHVDYAVLPSELLSTSEVVIAKVAGYDSASLGLPASNLTAPLLALTSSGAMVAATQISRARRRRFSPSVGWMHVVWRILTFGAGSSPRPWLPTVKPLWTASVTASFSATEPLGPDAELQCLRRGVEFFQRASLVISSAQATQLADLNCGGTGGKTSNKAACYEFAANDPPYNSSAGGGQLGIFEGFTSSIDVDGRQLRSLGIRQDCVAETSASFAVKALVAENATDRRVATNLLNYAHIHSGFSQPWIVGAGDAIRAARPWATGDGFGILAWTTADQAYEQFYKDDDARGLLGAVASAGLLLTPRWHSTIVTAVLGNLRQTSVNGFGPASETFADIVSSGGWEKTYNSKAPAPNISPHYQSYIWAVFLWGYSKSGFRPLLDRATAALEAAMEQYPQQWVPTSNGIAMQRARIILPLAFLVRTNDTARHRQWLQTAIDGLATRQHCDAEGGWCAFKEELNHTGWGGSTRVPNNDDYGTFEAPLNQENDDPVSDFLYTSNFAFLGLHEAAAVTGNATVKAMEDSLANYLVRVQARSTEHPEMDGAYTRAFDYQKWESWASDADIGWGAWSVETGWTQSWITTTMGMRLLNTSLWELGASIEGIEDDFETWIPTMFPPPPPPSPPPPCFPGRADPDGGVSFNMSNTIEQLCSDGTTPVTTVWTGHVCTAVTATGDRPGLLWETMKTVNPRPGIEPAACSWTRSADPSDVPGYFGGCNTPATVVPRLPDRMC